MRLDLFLKVSRLVVRRTVAQELCAAGRVIVNGTTAKAGREIKIGDEILLKRPQRELTVRVSAVPQSKQTARDAAASLYEIINEKVMPEEF